jgi:predicted TIM-barrel enzyme
MPESRSQILKRFRKKIKEGKPLIGGGAGTGISAKCEEAGGIDLIVIYNSGRFRMAGHGSLAGLMPFGDANAIVLEMANEVLPVVKETPVLAGVCGTDPMRIMGRFLEQVKATGFAGVQNFPTVGLIDGSFRQNLEETNMGYGREIEMIRLARGMELLTTPYVFNVDDAERMTKAGADILVAHMGLTTKGSIGAKTARTLEQCVPVIESIAGAARAVRGDIIVLCHGGPIAEPEDAAYILKHCPAIHGFYGASSMERLPTERAIKEQTEKFTRIRTGRSVTSAQRKVPHQGNTQS